MSSSSHDGIYVPVDIVCESITTRASRRDRGGHCNPFECGKASREQTVRDKSRGQGREDEKIPDLWLGVLVIGKNPTSRRN